MGAIARTLVSVPLALALAGALVDSASAQPDPEPDEWMYRQYLRLDEFRRGGEVEPHWLDDGSRFWFVERGSADLPVYLVDPRESTRRALFDLAPLRERLRRDLGDDVRARDLSLHDVRPAAENGGAYRAVLGERVVRIDSRSGEIHVLPGKATIAPARPNEVVSPDGAWAARVEEHDIWLRSLREDREIRLTTDGNPDRPWGAPGQRGPRILWSPDGSRIAVQRMDLRSVPEIPIVSYADELPEVERVRLWYAEGPLETAELFILGLDSRQRVRVEAGSAVGSADPIHLLGWRPDGSELLFADVTWDQREIRLSAADAETGRVRPLFTERTDSFFHITSWNPLAAIPLPETNRFLWRSDRDGRDHLYVYDFDGHLVRQLTRGSTKVFQVIDVDEERGWVYFTAHPDPAHPYDLHLCRLNLDGGDAHQLTEGRGRHQAVLSPDKEVFVDTYRNVDLLPVVELRSTDGTFLDTLSAARLDGPEGFHWTEPEEFVVKAADGETDLHGVLYKPHDFDPRRRYPVVELMLGRPDVAVNTILRWHSLGGEALAQLGFIVVAVDGRGTPGRGRAFHGVVHGALGRVEIADHVAALEQLFDERPYMDRNRVGVTGFSFGGYYTIRAMLQAPDKYHVGVAGAPYDPRGDASLPYLGLPSENPEAYDHASNLWMADRLEGRLLLYHGTADEGAYLFSLMQFLNALVEAGKPFDLLMLPDEGHDLGPSARAYVRETTRRYFQEHLQDADVDPGR